MTHQAISTDAMLRQHTRHSYTTSDGAKVIFIGKTFADVFTGNGWRHRSRFKYENGRFRYESGETLPQSWVNNNLVSPYAKSH